MKDLKQVVKNITSQVEERGIINVLELKPFFRQYSGKDWRKFFSPKKGKPGNKVLFQNDQFRLVLNYWDPYKKTRKHGHPPGGGLMKLLSGTLIETRFDPDDPKQVIGKYQYVDGDIAYIHDRLAYHVVENPSAIPAVSLHVYSPGIYISKVIRDSEPPQALQIRV